MKIQEAGTNTGGQAGRKVSIVHIGKDIYQLFIQEKPQQQIRKAQTDKEKLHVNGTEKDIDKIPRNAQHKYGSHRKQFSLGQTRIM